MPKSHKPGVRSQIRVNYDRKGKEAKNIEYWKAWDAGWRPDTYLEIPRGLAELSVNDPRKNRWRKHIGKRRY